MTDCFNVGSTTSQDQLYGLRFCQNAISRSQAKLSEVRKKVGKGQEEGRERSGKMKVEKGGHLVLGHDTDHFRRY